MYLIKCKGGSTIICSGFIVENKIVRIFDAQSNYATMKDAEDIEIAIEVIKLKSVEYVAHIEDGECEEEADADDTVHMELKEDVTEELPEFNIKHWVWLTDRYIQDACPQNNYSEFEIKCFNCKTNHAGILYQNGKMVVGGSDLGLEPTSINTNNARILLKYAIDNCGAIN